jgi:KOW motif
MPKESIPQAISPMVEVSYAEGDRVRITKGKYEGKTGEIETIGRALDGTPLYLIAILLVYEKDQIERVESEVEG